MTAALLVHNSNLIKCSSVPRSSIVTLVGSCEKQSANDVLLRQARGPEKDPPYDVVSTRIFVPKTSIFTPMPHTNTTHATNTYHLPLLLGVFILAFFPSLIGPLLYSPLTLLSYTCGLLPWSSDPPPPASVQQEASTATMSWTQKQFTLPAKSRGSYLITDTVMEKVPEIKDYKVGILQLFVQHTSCALSLNENWDEDVR